MDGEILEKPEIWVCLFCGEALGDLRSFYHHLTFEHEDEVCTYIQSHPEEFTSVVMKAFSIPNAHYSYINCPICNNEDFLEANDSLPGRMKLLRCTNCGFHYRYFLPKGSVSPEDSIQRLPLHNTKHLGQWLKSLLLKLK